MTGIRNPRDLAAGLVLLVIAAAILWFGRELPMGQATRLGPGYIPRAIAILVALIGVAIAGRALVQAGEGIPRGNLKGVALVLAAILIFMLLLERVGLVVSSLALLMTASAATADFRPLQSLAFAICLTVFCALVFGWGLGLTAKLFPW